LNLNNCKIIEAMGLKIIASRSPWMASPPTKFHENLPVDSKLIISGGHRNTGDLINQLWFLESRLRQEYNRVKYSTEWPQVDRKFIWKICKFKLKQR
jgi:hypothetical protein